MLLGDFNAKHEMWKCNRSNTNGRTLKKFAGNNSIVVNYPEKHTHYPTNGMTPITLDLTLTKNTTDWNKFRKDLNQKITINSTIETADKLELEIDKLTKTLQQLKTKHTKTKIVNTDKDHLPDKIVNFDNSRTNKHI